MKHLSLKKALLAALTAALLPFVAACSDEDDLIIDYAPINFYFEIVDASGNDLLNPDSEGCFGENFTLEYEGQSYDCVWEAPAMPESRMWPAFFNGLFYDYSGHYLKGTHRLVFGDFYGGDNYDIDMAFIEPDGTKHSMHYYRRVKKLDVKEKLTFDGQTVKDGNTIRIVK